MGNTLFALCDNTIAIDWAATGGVPDFENNLFVLVGSSTGFRTNVTMTPYTGNAIDAQFNASGHFYSNYSSLTTPNAPDQIPGLGVNLDYTPAATFVQATAGGKSLTDSSCGADGSTFCSGPNEDAYGQARTSPYTIGAFERD